MIEKVKVSGFKSLKEVCIDLGRFTVLVGPSNSGKSNILDSLLFICETTQKTLSEAFLSRGSYDSVAYGGQEAPIEFSLDVCVDGKKYSYSLSLQRDEVKTERLLLGTTPMLEREANRLRVWDGNGAFAEASVGDRETAVYALGKKETSSFRDFATCFSSWRLYRFNSAGDMRGKIDARSVFELDQSGRNLTQVLLSLRNADPEIFDSVEDALRKGVPEIENLLTPLTPDGRTHLAVREQGFDRDFDSTHLSDGTLKYLAYITAALLPGNGLTCFEEPENSVHPRLLELIVDLFKESDRQIVVCTHTPYIVNFVDPHDVRIVEKKLGETITYQVGDLFRLRDTLRVILS